MRHYSRRDEPSYIVAVIHQSYFDDIELGKRASSALYDESLPRDQLIDYFGKDAITRRAREAVGA